MAKMHFSKREILLILILQNSKTYRTAIHKIISHSTSWIEQPTKNQLTNLPLKPTYKTQALFKIDIQSKGLIPELLNKKI